MPVDVVFGMSPDEGQVEASAVEYVAGFQKRLRKSYELARKHLGNAAMRRKDQYDASVKGSQIQVWTWVWYVYPSIRQGLSVKWQRWYTGPYLVVRVIDSHCYVIEKSQRSRAITVHRDKLKVCFP
jgi:hypothetical protein